MANLSKRKKSFSESFKPDAMFSLEEAIASIEKFPKVKFDETVEVHLNLNINIKTSDQMVRGTVVLPHGTGKKIRIAVICKGEYAQKAEDAGADYVGGPELIEKIANGFMDFDCLVATPDMMRDLSKLGKVLGPRGLMPSPKAGTVSTDVERVIKEVKAGRVEFKSDKQCGIHVGIGKRSFSKEQLLENAKHLLEAVDHAKPASVKGNLIKTLSISTTMGPGLNINVAS
ncbi:MAG TPA: 50S ribosomal protein L1 [Candidatus Omnitrophota bacterium]|nr:50S ribosomal protein L1 [Candidatus Omnitrophota bacterium]